MKSAVDYVDNILSSNQSLANDFGKFSKIYFMTTENIKGFLQQYDLTEKNVLTVAGSGDQMLNSYLMGAKNVTCFDINPLAFYQVKLKKAAVSSLSYDEFIFFFFQEFEKCLDYSLFRKMQDNLDQDTIHFFEYLYSKYSSQEIFKKIYYRFQPSLHKMKSMNAYLEEDNYYKLSAILKDKDISFIESDITRLEEKLNNQLFDMILLSNISDSIDDIWQTDSLQNYRNFIYSLNQYLDSNGTVQVGYIYDYYANRCPYSFHHKEKRQAVFTSREFHSTFVESYRFYSNRDVIITFQKQKNIH